MVYLGFWIDFEVWVCIGVELGLFWLGENAGENPDFWVREGAPRREAALGLGVLFVLLGAVALKGSAAVLGYFQDRVILHF